MGALVMANDASAFSVKTTATGAFVHWESESVDYTLDPSFAASVPGADVAARRAMASWSGTVGAPELDGVDPSATKDAPTSPAFDQKNGIFFMPNGYAPAGQALAITVLTYDRQTGEIRDADIVVNGIYRFAVLEPSATSTTTPTSPTSAHPSNTDSVTHADQGSTDPGAIYDLHHVIAHELGHSLGMNDELVRHDALMYRYSAPNDATVRAPETDDIQGLAELYSTRISATGGGCGSSTIAPKKPTSHASELAMIATLGFLVFLALRGRGDRRARLAFVAAAAVATYALVPSVSGKRSEARADAVQDLGAARAKVLETSVSMQQGLLQTSYRVSVIGCRTTSCPKVATGVAWGGTAGNIRQVVGGQVAPESGDDVDVSFATLPNQLAPLTAPLGARMADLHEATVRVLTRAQ